MTMTLTYIDARREELTLELAALDKVRDCYNNAVENVRQLVSLNYPDLVDGLWKELDSIRGINVSEAQTKNGIAPPESEVVEIETDSPLTRDSATILQGMDKSQVQALASKLKIAHNPKTTKNQLIDKIIARPKEELEKYIMAGAV